LQVAFIDNHNLGFRHPAPRHGLHRTNLHRRAQVRPVMARLNYADVPNAFSLKRSDSLVN
jgi:hypothetical protein